MITKGRKKGTLQFTLSRCAGAKNIFVAGTFTAWTPRRMRQLKDGTFALTLPVPSGEHEYKFLIDGEWVIDLDNPRTEPNAFGTFNSVTLVK